MKYSIGMLPPFLRKAILIFCVFISTSFPLGAKVEGRRNKTDTITILDDFGGLLNPRARRILEIMNDGSEVRIIGNFCYSACTMYLALPNLCISAKTKFGFHAPSYFGIKHPKGKLFDDSTRFMASYYPEPVQTWFLHTGRYTTSGYRILSGSHLIDLGIRECK